ncbi:MAG: hypothetical protein ACRDRP_17985 [Pseudonocardiaceae bacterium]
MSDALSFVEIDGQHVELLPARTVLSLFSVSGTSSGESSTTSTTGTTDTASTPANTGGAGSGKAAFLKNWIYVEGDMTNTLTGGAGGAAGGTSEAAS